MTTEERCPTRLLADLPAEKDAFGSHERVAHSIAEVVQIEDGGRSIGLEGDWGAGKSTIVRLASEKLAQSSDCDHRVSVFDIWAHQDDPLRRTFLENLITSVQGYGWVNKKEWDRRKAELAGRRREDKTTVSPKLTPIGKIFALTLLAIPFGAALISAGATLLASEHGSGTWATALLVLGGVALLASVLFFVIMAVILLLKRTFWPGDGEEGGWLNELPPLMTGQTSTESRTIVTQTPDPTSVEFEFVFRDLLSHALKPENRKLLLVIDNLDRVQPSDALSIWSTLQTFLGHSDYERASWIDRLWVLIPYDGSAILRLWDKLGSEDEQSTNPKLAASFLDKTFQVRFRVPPLLLSDWRAFLKEALQEALPEHQEADFHGVYRAYATKGGLERSAPTPRDLKIFVNQIGALHREWQDEFPLSYLACYVLIQKDGEDERQALLSKEEWEYPRRIIGNQWRDVFAAFHFGAPVAEARQLLLKEQIQTALSMGDGKALAELASTHPTGFWEVLEDSVPAGAQDWNSLAPADLAKAATALSKSGVFEHADSRSEAVALRLNIRAAATAKRTWTPFDSDIAQGIVAIGHLVGNMERVVPALLKAVTNSRVESKGEEEDVEADEDAVEPSEWVSSAFTVIDGFVEQDLGSQMDQGIEIPLSAQQWLNDSSKIAKRDPDGRILQYFHLQAITEIDALLAEQAVQGQIDDDVVAAVHATLMTLSRDSMNETSNAVLSNLQSDEQIPGDQLALMLKVLRFLKEAGLITGEQYAELATGGWLLHHLNQAHDEENVEAIGECMFGFLEAVPSATEPPEVGNSNAGYEVLNELLKDPDDVPGVVECFIARAKEDNKLAAVLGMSDGKNPSPPFLLRVVRALLSSEDVLKPQEQVRSGWRVIRDALRDQGEDSQSFVTFLAELPEIDDLVADVLGSAFDYPDSGLYLALLRGHTSKELEAWCADGLTSIVQQEWLKELKSRGDLVELVIELKAKGASVTLGLPYFDALIEYAEYVSGRQRGILPIGDWRELVGVLTLDQKELFPRRAYQVLEASNGKASAKFFDLFGEMLSDHDLLANELRLIDRVCRPILDENNLAGLGWMATIADSDPALFTGHGDKAATNDFIDRVRQRLNEPSEDDETLPHLKRIGTALGIESL